MNHSKIIEPIGLWVGGVTVLLSFLLFYSDTQTFFGSVFAALIAGGMSWMTYVILRLLWITLRSK